MADARGNPGPGFLTKLKGIATDAGTSVAQAGKTIVDTVIGGDADFDHVRYLDQLGRQHKVQRKKFTTQQLEEAELRADKFIQTLHPGYTEEGFDPVRYELEMLEVDSTVEDMDALVEKMSAGVEIVSGKLSRHVMARRERLLEGINTVAQTEEDLRSAFLIVRSGRTTLKGAAEAVMQNMRVAGQTRRKQGYLELIALCAKIKSIKDLQSSLKHAQENGEYGEAILLCVQSFQEVDSLKELSVHADLHAAVQRRYVETLQRLDSALTALCGHFDPLRYSKVLEAYMLQGMTGSQLAEKVLTGFSDFIFDATLRVVRSMLLLKPKSVELLTSSSFEGSYHEICRNLPVDLLRPCLLKLMEVIFDLLASFHLMALWHKEGLVQQGMALTQAPISEEDLEGESPYAGLTRAESSAAEQVAINVGISYLTSVNAVLETSRPEVFSIATKRLLDLLNMPGLFKPEDFLQIVEWTNRYLGVGEAFVGRPLHELRNSFGATTSVFFENFHRGSMETLEMLLENEEWRDISQSSVTAQLDLDSAIRNSPLYTPSYDHADGLRDFSKDWVDKGNPFKVLQQELPARSKKARSTWGEVIRPKALAKAAAAEAKAAAEKAAEAAATAERVSDSGFTTRVSSSGRSCSVCVEPSANSLAVASRLSSSSDQQSTAGSSCMGAGGSLARELSCTTNGETGAILTVSSQYMLKLIHAYGQLLKPMPYKAETILHSIFDMFDKYLLRCFIYFSGVSMEVLVWQDNVLPRRLKSALMRILTSPDSMYKQEVEELMRTKPVIRGHDVPMGTASGISFLDKFAAKMESIANDLERSAQKLGDRASNALPDSPSRSGGSNTPPFGSPRQIGDQSNLHSLHERIVAAESLIHIASTLKGGKAALQVILPPMLCPEAEDWFSPRGAIAASSEMQATIFRGGARALLQPMLDPMSGISAQIQTTDYFLREPLHKQHRWAEAASLALQGFKESMSRAQLSSSVKLQIWRHAVETTDKVMVEGMSRIRKCTLEGRASLTFDISYVEKQLKVVAPAGLDVELTSSDQYCKAFYLPWEDLSRWCQLHLPQFGKKRVIALIELIAESHKIRKGPRNELLNQVEVFSNEFACY